MVFCLLLSGVNFASAVSGDSLLSLIADDIGFASVVPDGGFLSLITSGDDFTSVISSGASLSFIAGSVGSTSTISGGDLFFLIAGDGPSSLTAGNVSLSANSLTLSLSGTLSYVCYHSLASSVAPLTGFAILIIGKRLFDEAFIKQKPLASTQ